jgi:hypothetical protein
LGALQISCLDTYKTKQIKRKEKKIMELDYDYYYLIE